jgi:hypothetical protein
VNRDQSPLWRGLTGERSGDTDLPELCKIDTVENTPLLRGGRRDDDRVRLMRYCVNHPEGVPLPKIVRDVFGKTGAVQPADKDYQFARRFYTENPDYFDTDIQNGMTAVRPALAVIDLITEGISQKYQSEADLTDRQFCRDLVGSVSALDAHGKDVLAESIQRYVDRIEDYVMLFEVENTRTGRSRRFSKPYKTRFNDLGRLRQQWARFNATLDWAHEHADNAVLCTLTTDPKRHDSIEAATEAITENFARLLSWMAYEPKQKPSSRPGYRPEYLRVLEFTERGYPHLHVLFFDVPERNGRPYLIDKNELSRKWSNLGQGQIVDLQGLEFRDDLGDRYAADEGFVALDDPRLDADDELAADGGAPVQEFVPGQTAGQYLGKYLSAMFGGVVNLATGEEFDADGKYADKAATWKLALYWATERRMWSISKTIEDAIRPEEEERSLPIIVRHIGTYRYWDLPSQTTAQTRDFAEIEDLRYFQPSPDVFDGLDPPAVPISSG